MAEERWILQFTLVFLIVIVVFVPTLSFLHNYCSLRCAPLSPCCGLYNLW